MPSMSASTINLKSLTSTVFDSLSQALPIFEMVLFHSSESGSAFILGTYTGKSRVLRFLARRATFSLQALNFMQAGCQQASRSHSRTFMKLSSSSFQPRPFSWMAICLNSTTILGKPTASATACIGILRSLEPLNALLASSVMRISRWFSE